MHRSAPLALILVMVLTGGCQVLSEFGPGQPAVTAQLEIFNRTEADLIYVAADGERLEVPACRSAIDESFRVDMVQVRTSDGYIRAFGIGASDFAGRQLTLVEVASARDSGIPEAAPAPNRLPPCQGLPEVQVGV